MQMSILNSFTAMFLVVIFTLLNMLIEKHNFTMFNNVISLKES